MGKSKIHNIKGGKILELKADVPPPPPQEDKLEVPIEEAIELSFVNLCRQYEEMGKQLACHARLISQYLPKQTRIMRPEGKPD